MTDGEETVHALYDCTGYRQKTSGHVLLNPQHLYTQGLCAITLMPGSHVRVPDHPLNSVSPGSVGAMLFLGVCLLVV